MHIWTHCKKIMLHISPTLLRPQILQLLSVIADTNHSTVLQTKETTTQRN